MVKQSTSGPSSRVTAVTRWRDAYGNEHATQSEAEGATLKGDVDLAAHRLWTATSDAHDLHKEGDLALVLADAIQAERQWTSHHEIASA